MTDLERLNEALTDYENAVHKGEVVWDQKAIVVAARAYRDLLANGQRVWVCEHNRGGERLCREVHAYEPRLHVTCGWKLLVDPTTEEER